jgi:hypothetical protein
VNCAFPFFYGAANVAACGIFRAARGGHFSATFWSLLHDGGGGVREITLKFFSDS